MERVKVMKEETSGGGWSSVTAVVFLVAVHVPGGFVCLKLLSERRTREVERSV